MLKADRTLFPLIRKTVIHWFEKNGRDFPWRESSDPYQILIAEMMLRRTTAKAVLRIYPNFIEKYPSLKDLSISPLEDIEQTIQTLGLQSQRARHLKDMAVQICERYDCDIVSMRDELLSLPGVGRYVAAAVRNFGFGISESMVDGNIVHFLNRVTGIAFSGSHDKQAWTIMADIGGRNQDKRLYWGIIDLVALLCLRRNPRCLKCPLVKLCEFVKSKSK